jgi:hypothetical protein
VQRQLEAWTSPEAWGLSPETFERSETRNGEGKI